MHAFVSLLDFLFPVDFLLRLPADGLAEGGEVGGEGHIALGVGEVQAVFISVQVERSDSLCWMTASSLSRAL